MTDSMTFTGTLTLQDSLDLNHYLMLCMIRRSIQWLMAIASTCFAALVILAINRVGFKIELGLILALCFYFPSGWRLRRRFNIAHRYRRHPEQIIEHTVKLDQSSVFISNVDMDLRLDWNQVGTVVSTPRGILFLAPPYTPLFWLPERLFDNDHPRVRVLEMAREHSITVKEIS